MAHDVHGDCVYVFGAWTSSELIHIHSCVCVLHIYRYMYRHIFLNNRDWGMRMASKVKWNRDGIGGLMRRITFQERPVVASLIESAIQHCSQRVEMGANGRG